MLADFAALSEMIVEVAKWRYRVANPTRRPVPRGFADGISLRLMGIEEGSAVPVIGLFVAGNSQSPDSPAQPYFLDARRAIVEAVGAAEQSRPITALPERFLGFFDRFGRNLVEAEAIEFDGPPDGPPIRLTRETRRTLILASSEEVFTDETTVHGLVHEFDQRAKTFQLTLPSGTVLGRIPVESQHYDTVLEASNGFREKLRVRIFGVCRFDRNNRSMEFEKVERLTILDPLDIRVRIDEFRLLENGWLDGEGVAPAHSALDWLVDAFDAHFPDDVRLPYLFPTPTGGILAEWSLPPWAPSLEFDLTKRQGAWHNLNLDTDEESARELDLTEADAWQWLGEQVRACGGEIV